MKTPKTDEVCKLLIGNSFEGHPLVDLSRSLEVQVQELRQALEELVLRCESEEGVRKDGDNVDTLQARAVLERTK